MTMWWHPALVQKAWLDTRVRFLIGLLLLLFVAAANLYYIDLTMEELLRVWQQQIQREAAFRDYMWHMWIRTAFRQLTALFAVVIAAGGLLSQATRGGGTFLLSLPVTRGQLLWTRTIVGLLELAALTVLPMLTITALSAAMGQSYRPLDAAVHAACLFAGGLVLFSATTWLSTVFGDVWRPPLVALCGVIVIGFVLFLIAGSSRNSLLGVMTGESWFRDQQFPAIGVFACAAISAALLYLTGRRLARLDF